MECEVLRQQVAITEIASPTGAEAERARWLASRLRLLGYAPRIDAAGNVIARTSWVADPPVVVCAHLDTVFPAATDLACRVEGPRVIGPGICDNGRGLAVMLALADSLRRCSAAFAQPVELVATTGEEGAGDLRGAKHYFANAERPVAVIALDGAGDERIVNSAVGSRRYRVCFRGPGGHSWSAFGTVNPVHAAARAAAAIAGLGLPDAARSALTVSRIGGGLSVNSIPESAWFEVDARSTSAPALEAMDHAVRAASAAATASENDGRAAGTPPLSLDIECIGERPGGGTSADSDLVATAIAATRLVRREPELAAASTDANAAMGLGIPAIAIGAGGRGGDAHSTHEWFDGTAAAAGVDRAFTIVAAMARHRAD